MESKNRPILGGSIVLERQERFSIQTSETIYLHGRRLYRNPPVTAARNTTSSDEIEKIHRTRERVESLNHQINHEIDRLKEVNNSFKNRKEERRMTWAERFKANRPIVRQQGGGGRCACPGKVCRAHCRTVEIRPSSKDGFPKPASQEVKQKDVTPIKPPPKVVSHKGISKEIKSKEFYLRKLPPKELPPRKLPPKELPPKEHPPRQLPKKELPPRQLPKKELPPRQLPKKALPPRQLPPKELPANDQIARKSLPRVFLSKRLPLKGLQPKELNPRKPPTKVILPKDLPPKGLPPKRLPPKELTPQKPLPKRIPLKDLPPKEPPLKTRKPPANSSIQKELKPGKPPPKDLTTENPKPKEEPRQSELRCEDSKPKKLADRLSGGCCNCCCHYPTSYGAPDCCYNIAFNRGIEHGIPYCTARRRVTDLNTQEICGNRCVSISPDRRTVGQQRSSKLSVPPSSFLEIPKEKRKSPIRSEKLLSNENNRQKNKMRNQEKFPKLKSQEKESKVQGSLRMVESRENIKQGKLPKVHSPEIPLKNKFQYPENLKRETEVVPPKIPAYKESTFNEDERMYQEYLRLYYQENSKEDLQEGVKPIPTYTKLRKENVKPTAQRECPENQINSWEGQRVSKCRDSQKVKTPILDQCNHERKTYQDPRCSIEMYPTPFTYESCFDEWGSTSLHNNTTDSVSDSPPPSPTPTPTPAPTPPQPPTNCKETRFHYPSASGATGADIKYTNCPDKDHQGLRQKWTKERVVAPEVSKNHGLRKERSKFTKESVEDPKHQGLRQERTREIVVAKNVYQDPSSLPRDLETDSTSYASLPVKHQNVSPPMRQANTTTEPQRRQERSSLTYPTRSSQNSNQVYNGRHSNLSSKAGSSRKPTTDAHQQSNPHPFSHVEGLSRNQESPTVDSHSQSKPSPFSLVEGLSRNQESTTTHSHRRSNPSPEFFGAQSPTTVATETIATNTHYQDVDPQSSNEDQKFDMKLLESRLKKELKNSTDNKEFKEAFSILSEKTTQSPSPQGSFKTPLSKEFKDSQAFEINDEEKTEKTFHRKREDSAFRQFHSEARNQDQEDEIEYSKFLNRKTHYSGAQNQDEEDDNVSSTFLNRKAHYSEARNQDQEDENEYSKFLDRKKDYSKTRNQDEEDHNVYSTFLNRKTHYSEAQNQDEEEDNEYSTFFNRNKDYSNRSDDIQSRCECDGYETARSMASSKHHHLLSAMSSSRNKSYDEKLPTVATVCDKRTRTVTFKDEEGVLNKRSHVEEQCRSHIDWEQALKYRQPDSIFPNENYTPRSSSSAEHTCLESSWEEEEGDAYDSCLETLSPRAEQKPSFKACPCMYETYRQLAALCHSKSPYYR